MQSDNAFKSNLEDVIRCERNDYEENADAKRKNFENKLSEEGQLELEYYGNLELQAGASFEQIKSQYRKLLKKYHPDKFQNDREKQKTAEEVVCKLNKAYSYFEQKMR